MVTQGYYCYEVKEITGELYILFSPNAWLYVIRFLSDEHDTSYDEANGE